MAHVDDAQTQKANLNYIKRSMKQPFLSRDREFDLARRWRDQKDHRALHELVNAYARLVIATAARFRNYGLPMGDLVQEGNIGLMQAASRFEPERDVRFSTYASWWIRSTMQDFVLRNWSIVRTGTTAAQKTLFFNLRRMRAKIEKDSGAPLDREGLEKIAQDLGVTIDEVEQMELRLSACDRSLNAPISEEGEDEAQSLLTDERPTPEQTTISLHDAATRSKWLAEALQALSPRERTIISHRRLRDDGATLEQLGHDLGVSKERVRQLENRALQKLKTALLSKTNAMEDLLTEA